ncbi:MAG: zinc-dependent metalloprotease [Calditrichia bacterium]
MKFCFKIQAVVFFICLLSATVFSKEKPAIADAASGMEKYTGYFDFYWNAEEGKVLLQIDRWDEEFLYVNSLVTGVGSNDIGLDRGQLGSSRIVRFQRTGPKVILIESNYAFRASTDNAEERRAIEEAFAISVLGGFSVVAETDGSVLVDATSFFLRDAHGVSQTLNDRGQGSFSLDGKRSVMYLENTKSFPRNSEFEALLTFSGRKPGQFVQQVVPTPTSISVRQRHSFVKLPDDKYEPRVFDPRSGYIYIEYQDYGTPIGDPLVKRFITRHRLQKKNPSQTVGPFEVVEPIVYYLDPGTPEPIRSALLDGARWWTQAFEEAGFKDAYRVEMLPTGADPMDVRYNVIQWVHRATRGWSYGDMVSDPRTGEIIKGHVSLGSLRVRQDYLIAEGLLAPYKAKGDVPKEMQEMALARLRQLSAHEVGHTIGLTHNFAASAYTKTQLGKYTHGSVMDYPHPFATLGSDGKVDLSRAYAVGIGAWDSWAIRYGYSLFDNADGRDADLENVLQNPVGEFIGDSDARPRGGANPSGHLWDNGLSPVVELERIMKLRKNALVNFTEDVIPFGTPLSQLEESLMPVYFMHRYQIEAAAKLIGGVNYDYQVRGQKQVLEVVDPSAQQAALRALMDVLMPEQLLLPESIRKLVPPKSYGTYRGRESLSGRMGPIFDPLAPAEMVIDLTLDMLLNRERAARLIVQGASDKKTLSLDKLMEKLYRFAYKNNSEKGLQAEVRAILRDRLLERLMNLAADSRALTQVKSTAYGYISKVRKDLNGFKVKDSKESKTYLRNKINRFMQDPASWKPGKRLVPPAGSPIGSSRAMQCSHE